MDLRIAALADVIEGIEYLHSNGVVHGDIKPLNVLVCGDGISEFNFKVADYASYMANPSQTSHSMTLKQMMTPGYMAPEVFPNQGAAGCSTQKPSKASDIYSFAIMAYEVVFLCQAWDNVHIALMESVKQGQRPVIPSEADEWVSNLIKECWLGDPEARPTAAAV
ncbi:probable LIM domain-containing serine/threonine-protein kinase DDB_G0287001 [Dysidea avara]|uniref:probable LIM domain-containing serine/threonine-protein kinase DDB_G0287001 n=1 Tax=Dysidea avara TaxID=196820 RepID=UPI00332275BC